MISFIAPAKRKRAARMDWATQSLMFADLVMVAGIGVSFRGVLFGRASALLTRRMGIGRIDTPTQHSMRVGANRKTTGTRLIASGGRRRATVDKRGPAHGADPNHDRTGCLLNEWQNSPDPRIPEPQASPEKQRDVDREQH